MRAVLIACLLCLLASPALAAFVGPSVATPPVTTTAAALGADEGATCVLTGAIVERLQKDRYTFKDDSGSMQVNIPPHVFGTTDVTPQNTVRITGEIRGKRNPNRPDAHLGVRYIELVK